MRFVRRQYDGLPLPQPKTLARDLDVRLAVSDHYERIERRGMFAEALAHVKREQRNRAAFVLKQHAANDRAILVLQQVNELLDFSRSNSTLILITHSG